MVILKCRFCNKKYTIYDKKPIYNCQNYNDLNININHILDKNLLESNTIITKIKNIFKSGYYTNNIVDTNPYIIYKIFFFSYYLSQYLKIDFDKIIHNIDENLKIINRNTFIKTKIVSYDLNQIDINVKKNIKIFIKNETNNISGSHKSRHLMGNIIYFDILYKSNIYTSKPKLGIYSCGNAAMAASIIAKSAKYQLNAYIPTNVSQDTIEYLKSFDTNIISCPRNNINAQFGDPCYNKFKQAIKQHKIIPFSCSGIDNWSNIEGGQTLCLEYVFQLIKQNKMFDSVIIQVGGGALASSFIKTLNELYKLHIIKKLPIIYIAQTQGGFPTIRAYYLIIKEIAKQNNLICSLNFKKTSISQNNIEQNNKFIEYINSHNNEIITIANFIKKHYHHDIIQNILNKIIQYNIVNDYMWNWEIEPKSIAHGILDDITYDWIEIIHGLFKTGGIPIIITENDILNANIIAKKHTNINVSHTGSSGLAGLIKLDKLNLISQNIQSIAMIFTGIER